MWLQNDDTSIQEPLRAIYLLTCDDRVFEQFSSTWLHPTYWHAFCNRHPVWRPKWDQAAASVLHHSQACEDKCQRYQSLHRWTSTCCSSSDWPWRYGRSLNQWGKGMSEWLPPRMPALPAAILTGSQKRLQKLLAVLVPDESIYFLSKKISIFNLGLIHSA